MIFAGFLALDFPILSGTNRDHDFYFYETTLQSFALAPKWGEYSILRFMGLYGPLKAPLRVSLTRTGAEAWEST